jgi:hypothetical protein
MDDDLEQSLGEPENTEPLFRVIGFILIALAIILGVYGTVAYMAWQESQDAKAENARAILLEEIGKQLVLAQEDIDAANYTLAQRRLEWILQREPDHVEALELKQNIEQQMAAPTPTPKPDPTEPAVREETGPTDDDLERDIDEIETLVADEMWSEAVSALIAFQSDHPSYRRHDTDRLLYDSYISLGQELLAGEQVELGLYYFSQAETLGDLAQEIEDQRLWAELYLSGIAYYGVDWGTTISYFRDLCAAAPFFQNSCQKLREALVGHADAYAANLDFCPAEALYVEAGQFDGGATVSEKLANARLMCLEATPTAPITATEGLSETLPVVPSESEGEGQ